MTIKVSFAQILKFIKVQVILVGEQTGLTVAPPSGFTEMGTNM